MDDKKNECVICMEDIGQFVSVLKCGHKFHSKCIIEYGVKHNNKVLTCPLCRDTILDDTPLLQEELPVGNVMISIQPSNITTPETNDQLQLIMSKIAVAVFVGVCFFVVITFLTP
jgi:hypothetical protein